MFYSIEAIKQDESNARIRLEANEAARSNAETQLNNLKQLLEELQS